MSQMTGITKVITDISPAFENADLLEVGVSTWATTLVLSYPLLRTWARIDERKCQQWRVRRRTSSLLRFEVRQALSSDPDVSLNALQILAEHWRRHADLIEPDDEDFLEAVAAFVVMFGSGRAVRDRRRWPARWTVPEHKALAARLAVDIAVRRGRQPNTIAQWILGLPTEIRPRPVLQRTA